MDTENPTPKGALTTDEAAALLRVKAQTLRAALCQQGHYFGLRPVKLPNRFLLWPREAVLRVAAGGRA